MKKLTFLIALLAPTVASAHSWYDMECCHNQDCVPVKSIERHDDHVIMHTDLFGEVKVDQSFWRKTDKIKASRDQRYHICINTFAFGPAKSKKIRCIYVPPGV